MRKCGLASTHAGLTQQRPKRQIGLMLWRRGVWSECGMGAERKSAPIECVWAVMTTPSCMRRLAAKNGQRVGCVGDDSGAGKRVRCHGGTGITNTKRDGLTHHSMGAAILSICPATID